MNQMAMSNSTAQPGGFHHSGITRSLVGLDAVTVSILAGHRDTSMISRHYAHLTQKHDHMRDAENARLQGKACSTV